jgi:GGDEF domain-containing protein
MTQNQLDWMQDNGLDPAEYDMTPDGRVLRKQAAVAQEPEREVMSMPRAFGTSFLGNLIPSAASIAGAAAGMKGGAALGAFGGPVGAAIGGGIGGIGGGLGAGYLTGKGQQALLENYAPEAVAEMQRAETDQPVMSYLGGFAPNAMAMRPSVKGLSGLLRPSVRGEETLRAALTNPNFLNPAINVGANVAGSTAGQLVNMSEGGEFSVPRFAADVALGSLFNKPTGLGKRLGFSDIPENIQEAPGNLAKSRDRAELMANVPKDFVTPRAERGAQDVKTPGVNIGLEAPDQYFTAEGKPLTEKAYAADYSKWWKSETEPTTELLKAKAEEVKAKIPRDKLKELSNDPEVGEVLRDPSKMEAFVAKQADQTLEDVFQMMESRKAEEISRTEEASKAQQMQAEKARVEAEQNAIEIQKLQDLEASQALSDEAAERLQVLKSRRAELLYANKDQGPVQLKNIREQSDPAIAQAQKEVADARAIAEDIWTRLQRPEGKQSNKITQEDINLATELANRRGLKVQLDRAFAGSQEVRGMFLVDKNTGDRIIRINPLMATADTAIHEIGHDIFKGVTNKGMRRSLMDTALDSPAYKAELAARAEEVKAGRITQEQANDIALEEGLVQAFGEKMPDVNRGELRAWFSAFKASMKQLVTGKMSPEDALAWMHYATTENVPWKGVAVAKTRGGVEGEEATRYQRPIVDQAKETVKTGIDKTLGEIDQITRRGGVYETVGRAMTRAYNTADAMLGKARSLGLTITKLNYGDATKLTSHLYNEYKNQQLLTPAPEIAAAYKEWRTQAKAFWVDEANKAGFKITGSKGQRDRIESEFWFPGHKLSDEARDILASKIGTPEYQKLKSDYLRDAEADYLSRGKLMTEAQEKALADFEEQRALANKTFDPSAPATFAGARKPMGRPLPESWIEKDFRKLYESYNARSSKDYAAQEHFEKSPEVMAALGSKKFFNDQPIPASVLQSTEVIAPDPSVQSVMREFSGQPLQMPGKTIRSFGAAASALALQTISRIGDVGGTVTKPLAYIGLGDYGAYMGGMAEKLSDWSKLKARSIESGLNNPNANQDFHQVIGMGQDAGKYMQKVLDSIGFITGSSKLESVARTLAQAQGEMIVSINKRKAATGDKDAVRFLDTLNNDWRTQSDMALAAQFGQMMQGTYDMRQLPAWFLEGGAAPYLTWSKWSMSQMNNFRKFAVEPAMQGNLKPLIAQVLVGMAGGGAIEQVQEWLSGKESKSVKWSELESWARQNEGTIGTDGGELLLQKFMIMAQKTGTFGFAGDLAMMPINALVGDTQSSVGVFPAAELAADLAKNVAGALTAIDKGEDVGLVMQRFGKNVIVGKTQMARVASTWVDEVFNEGSENLRSADRRKARLFEELSGTGRSNGMFPVSYENLAEQKFERGSVTEDTGEEAFSLVSRARAEATSPEDYASRIRKLKTSQNAIMPSLERQPMKAARYLGFVEGAEPGKGSETLKRYYTRQNEDKYRKSLIEGMSGIR